MKKIDVSLKGFSKTKKTPVRKVLPKSASVCLEGQKISKNGKCIKDKKYVVVMTSSLTSKMPGVPTVCMEGYKFSLVTGKCRKITLGLSTVCKEGYKLTKNGRCIKDKKYTTTFSSVKITDIPAPTVTAAVAVSSPVKLANAETVSEVKEILKNENIQVPRPIENKLAKAETVSEVKEILLGVIPIPPPLPPVVSKLANAETPAEVKEVLASIIPNAPPPPPSVVAKLVNAETPAEVKAIIKSNNLLDEITKGVNLKKRPSSAPSTRTFSSPLDELKAGGFKLKSSSSRIIGNSVVVDKSNVKEKAFRSNKGLFDEISKGRFKLKSALANADSPTEVKAILKEADIPASAQAVEQLAVNTDKKEIGTILENNDTVNSVGPVVPMTPAISSAIDKIAPIDLKLAEAESYVKNVFKDYDIEYTGCSSLDEVLKNFKQKCIEELGYKSETLKQTPCLLKHLVKLYNKHPAFKKHLNTIGCIITQKKINDFA